ncbi:MAG TPA: urease accessory protein, partial [Janthinobacterium sp.]|nr:urease accessory protein [Janthinobacterium sp.]
DASFIGCEILCLGRRASGESFSAGRITQRTRILRDDKLIWYEQGALEGGGEMLRSPFGWNGRSVCATLIAVGRPASAALLAHLREVDIDCADQFGVTQMKGVLVARHLGDDSERARLAMLAVWRRLRPFLLEREAQVPRIWNT